MTIVSSVVVSDDQQADGSRKVVFEYQFDTGKVVIHGPLTIAALDDINAVMAALIPEIEKRAADEEVDNGVVAAESSVNPDKIAEYQTQEDFDRRLLGRMMLVDNIHVFYASYPFFQAMELRNGSNANQRATNLGVSSVEYGQVEDRYNDVSSLDWILGDVENAIWSELPEDWV